MATSAVASLVGYRVLIAFGRVKIFAALFRVNFTPLSGTKKHWPGTDSTGLSCAISGRRMGYAKMSAPQLKEV